MKIAVPIFGSRISPRFDYAPRFLFLVIDEEGNIVGQEEVQSQDWTPMERVSYLRKKGIETLICGGVPNFLHSLLDGYGIRVIPWITGEADEVIRLFLKGRLYPGTIVGGRGRRKRWRFCAGKKRW